MEEKIEWRSFGIDRKIEGKKLPSTEPYKKQLFKRHTSGTRCVTAVIVNDVLRAIVIDQKATHIDKTVDGNHNIIKPRH